MNKLLLLCILTTSLFSARAQEQETNTMSVGLGLFYAQHKSYTYAGPGVIFQLPTDTAGRFTSAFSVSSGLLYSYVQSDKELSIATDFANTRFIHPEGSSYTGSLFLIPLRASYLVGIEQDYLEVGAGVELQQFAGKRYTTTENATEVYRTYGLDLLYGVQVGYRHQPKSKGVFCSLLWKPSWLASTNEYCNLFTGGVGWVF